LTKTGINPNFYKNHFITDFSTLQYCWKNKLKNANILATSRQLPAVSSRGAKMRQKKKIQDIGCPESFCFFRYL